jgi:hypothetical protein
VKVDVFQWGEGFKRFFTAIYQTNKMALPQHA